MHGTGLFIALSTLSGGGKVVLVDSARLDAERTWCEVAREQVEALTIVGDAFARPLIDDLDAILRVRPVVAARHHVVGRHVEPGMQARHSWTTFPE